MSGIWLISYIVLWALALAGTAAILALARELVALQRELQMVRYQLAHEGEKQSSRVAQQAPEPLAQ